MPYTDAEIATWREKAAMLDAIVADLPDPGVPQDIVDALTTAAGGQLPDGILDLIDAGKFRAADGSVDTAKVASAVQTFAGRATGKRGAARGSQAGRDEAARRFGADA